MEETIQKVIPDDNILKRSYNYPLELDLNDEDSKNSNESIDEDKDLNDDE